jgi:hypothetical protein
LLPNGCCRTVAAELLLPRKLQKNEREQQLALHNQQDSLYFHSRQKRSAEFREFPNILRYAFGVNERQ